MDAFLNNPFRILGLPTTASDKEIAKRVSDLLIYAEMGKKISYETDFPFLGELDRSAESIKLAFKRIELPENKIFYSLLCFDLKDNLERDSIELLAKGDFETAIKVLKDEIYNNCPIIYKSENTVAYILKNFKQNFQKKYAITLGPPKGIAESIFSKISNNYFIIIYSNDEVVDIQEGYSEINLTDKYQIACKFKWVENQEGQDVSIRLGFIDSFDTKHFLQITNKGVIRFFKSDHLETEIEIDKAFFHETKSNFLALLRYDNFIEVRFNGKVPLKIEITESFKSSFLSFSGKQKVLIEDFSISSLKHFQILGIDDEINENTFSYSKNISIIYLIQMVKKRQIGPILDYFTITGNYLKKPYFSEYTKKIISNNYILNFNVLADIFVREFCLSLKHLIDPYKENSQFLFYNSFSHLSVDSEKKVIEILSNSKPHIFENYIKEVSLRRVNEPEKAYDFACELKNESVYFFNWYTDFHTEFHNFHSFESKSISDKIGNEILECSISYYNAISPKTIEIAKQSLKLMIWASDFAFNQVLRDRINNNISILLNTHPNTEYKIVDFGFKDRTRTTRRITPKDKPAETKTNNIPPQKTNNNQSSTTSTTSTRQPSAEKSKKINEKKRKIFKSIFKNAGGLFLIMLPIIVMIYLFFSSVFSGNSSLDNQKDISKPIENKIDNNSPIQSKSNLNIDLSNYKPNQQQAEVVENSKWAGNKLSNGDSPYDEYFGKGIYDYNSECYLIFKNGYSTDAIVCLENTTTGRTIRNEYIQAGTDFKMTNIPEGVYKVKTFSGNDWNPEKTLDQGAIKGAFDTDLSFSVSDNPSDLIQMSIKETGDGISYSTGEITLYRVNHGNMQQRNINSDEFFK